MKLKPHIVVFKQPNIRIEVDTIMAESKNEAMRKGLSVLRNLKLDIQIKGFKIHAETVK